MFLAKSKMNVIFFYEEKEVYVYYICKRKRFKGEKKREKKIVLNFHKNEFEAETQKFCFGCEVCRSFLFLSFKQPISLIYSRN